VVYYHTNSWNASFFYKIINIFSSVTFHALNRNEIKNQACFVEGTGRQPFENKNGQGDIPLPCPL